MEKKSLADKSTIQKITIDSNIEELDLFKDAKELFQEALNKFYTSEFPVKSVYQDLSKLSEDDQTIA